MDKRAVALIEKLCSAHSLSVEEYEYLLNNRTPEIQELLSQRALKLRREIYGNSVYIRGLIEISNICKNNCLYCGIRAENSHCER